MICVNCFHVKTKVYNSRPHKKPAVWRRRQCLNCLAVFTTYERPALDDQMILARDGSKHPYSIGKLIVSISRSFSHNSHSAQFDSLHLAETVETTLLTSGKELSADDIAAITHQTLKQFDPVAAIQYAAQHDLITTKRRPGRPSTTYDL